MTAFSKDSQVTFRTNKELLAKAKEIVQYENMDMSSLFNNLLEAVVEQERVPNILLKDEKSRRESIIDDLCVEILQGYESYEAGRLRSADEVVAKYDL